MISDSNNMHIFFFKIYTHKANHNKRRSKPHKNNKLLVLVFLLVLVCLLVFVWLLHLSLQWGLAGYFLYSHIWVKMYSYHLLQNIKDSLYKMTQSLVLKCQSFICSRRCSWHQVNSFEVNGQFSLANRHNWYHCFWHN